MAPTRQRRATGTAVAPGAATRRRLVWALTALLIAACAAALGWHLTGDRTARGPVVLISIDTLRADRIGAYGYAQARTPVLDAFAREAVVFDRAYAHAPQTLPSHASMFTGLLPFAHKVRDNVGFTLQEGATTLATLMRGAGYKTGGFV